MLSKCGKGLKFKKLDGLIKCLGCRDQINLLCGLAVNTLCSATLFHVEEHENFRMAKRDVYVCDLAGIFV